MQLIHSNKTRDGKHARIKTAFQNCLYCAHVLLTFSMRFLSCFFTTISYSSQGWHRVDKFIINRSTLSSYDIKVVPKQNNGMEFSVHCRRFYCLNFGPCISLKIYFFPKVKCVYHHVCTSPQPRSGSATTTLGVWWIPKTLSKLSTNTPLHWGWGWLQVPDTVQLMKAFPTSE